MPIQIIDNFDLNAQKPIDNRIVVGPTPSFYHNKNDIPNKYPGLRVWELPGAELGSGVINTTIAGLGYVYTGSASNPWVSENTTSIGGGANPQSVSNLQQLPLAYFNSPNSILDSDMFYNFADNNYGISAPPDQGQSSPLNNIAKLKVNGNVVISGKYVGDAGGADGGVNLFGITNINASNIVFGTMNIQHIGGNSNVGWILTSDTINSASYKVPSSINVGSSTQLQNPRLIYGNSFNGTANVTGNITFGTQPSKATIVYNQSQTLNLNVPTVTGSGTVNRTFALLEQATQTFTGAVIMGYVGTGNALEPHGLQVDGRTLLTGVVTSNTVNINGDFTVTHNDPAGGPSPFTKLKITEGVSQYWTTFGSESTSSSNNPPRIRSGNGALSTPSYTWRGDTSTGIYRPSAGQIGFSSNGTEVMRVTNTGATVLGELFVSSRLQLNYDSSAFRRLIVGTINLYYNGTFTIVYGTGLFTMTAASGTFNNTNARAYVNIPGGINGNPIVIASLSKTGIFGMGTGGDNNIGIATFLEIANNRFLIQVGGQGTTGEPFIPVSFCYFEVY